VVGIARQSDESVEGVELEGPAIVGR